MHIRIKTNFEIIEITVKVWKKNKFYLGGEKIAFENGVDVCLVLLLTEAESRLVPFKSVIQLLKADSLSDDDFKSLGDIMMRRSKILSNST